MKEGREMREEENRRLVREQNQLLANQLAMDTGASCLLLEDDMDIRNQTGKDVDESRANFSCAREEALEVLKWARCGAIYEDARTGRKMVNVYVESLDRAIDYLENPDPADVFAEDYAVRLDLAAEVLDQRSMEGMVDRERWSIQGRAEELREAADMLRSKDSR